ncbi:UDP-glucose 4-epimerase GalE [Halobacteriovorax sp. GB3]|uniref:UDP-glucose 4-epimerase GalE n=1 Tax=Halobacteriovorax sp. GB3 TaxID=2719615 RepID=UPI00236012BA|nr:UDP-glucose 4-epimerase GalE [Halobacteriovorax sp. GB3]MDD0852501.1 UDP-glucose 4-epimerase GalE [Halobacteriovorax sp. GB3]
MPKKILITGGAGYIGSHIVNLLGKDEQYELTIYDNLSTGRKESVVSGELVVGEIEDLEKLEALIVDKKFDACFHFAGSIIVPESVEDPLKYYFNNTQNTLNLLNLCIKHKINNFIFSSTAAVYGINEDGICTEETPVSPINPYGKTKLMTEQLLEDLSIAYPDFNYVVLRYFNVAGASIDGSVGQCSPLSTHLIKIACETALGKREKMFINGDDYQTKDGTCVRDYIHTDDLASAHVASLEYLLEGGKSDLFNCGYGHGFTVKEVVDVVKKVSNVDFDVELGPRRAGDAPVLLAKSDKIKSVLGWNPEHDDLELIVRTALDWEKKLK